MGEVGREFVEEIHEHIFPFFPLRMAMWEHACSGDNQLLTWRA